MCNSPKAHTHPQQVRNPRIAKARKLQIGERRPNVLIPVLYGSIGRVLDGTPRGDLDALTQRILKEKKTDESELKRVIAKYRTLPQQVKRRWSGGDHAELLNLTNLDDIAKRVMASINGLKAANQHLRHSRCPRLRLYPASYPGLQDPCLPDADRPGLCPDEPCICVPEPPSGDPGTKPLKRYIWEFGPALHCHDPYEDWLGDDLYAVYAYGDGGGQAKLEVIPKTGGTNDLDEGENGEWPFPQRVIYNGLAPSGYLHIEIDIWEKDYSAEFFGGLLDLLSAIAGAVGGLIGGAAGTAIGTIVGEALEAARSQISDADDDNFLGTLVFDYPQGEPDLHLLIGPRTIDWWSSTEDGVHYQFNYVIRELP